MRSMTKESAFYKHTGFKGADSHIDDKYGVMWMIFMRSKRYFPSLLSKKNIACTSSSSNAAKDEWHLDLHKIEFALLIEDHNF